MVTWWRRLCCRYPSALTLAAVPVAHGTPRKEKTSGVQKVSTSVVRGRIRCNSDGETRGSHALPRQVAASQTYFTFLPMGQSVYQQVGAAGSVVCKTATGAPCLYRGCVRRSTPSGRYVLLDISGPHHARARRAPARANRNLIFAISLTSFNTISIPMHPTFERNKNANR
jgi:hypothetical protein